MLYRKPPNASPLHRAYQQEGFTIVGALVALAVCTLIFFANLNLQVFQTTHLEKSDLAVTLQMLQTNTLEIMTNPSTLARTFSTVNIGGNLMNTGSHQKTIMCIISTRNGGPTTCENHKVPKVFTGHFCDDYPHIDQKKTCWIRAELTHHQIWTILHPDPDVPDPIISIADENYGLTHEYKVCQGFDMEIGGEVDCSYRMRYYVWVECDGGASACGGATGISGQIKMAAFPEVKASQGVHDPTRHSILDFPVGAL